MLSVDTSTVFPGADRDALVEGAKERLMRTGELPGKSVRPLVSDSWRRCHRAGVDPRGAVAAAARATPDVAAAQSDRELVDASAKTLAEANATRATLHQYVVRLRLERAKVLLSGSSLPLAEVAAQTGFADQSHFTSTFRRKTSMTPRSYRNATAVS